MGYLRWAMLVGVLVWPLILLGQAVQKNEQDIEELRHQEARQQEAVQVFQENLGVALDANDFQWDFERLGWFLLFILGAIGSAAILAYHPLYLGRVASLLEMDYPKIIITYTVVGALIAPIVREIPAMGLAIFGIGGLMRFRTILQSAKETGRVILATIIGICWGLEMWPVAISITIIAWLLILILDWRVGYRIIVRGLEGSLVGQASTAYQNVLIQNDCQITQTKKNPRKEQFSIVFRASRKMDRDEIEDAFEMEVDGGLKGTVDWPEEG